MEKDFDAFFKANEGRIHYQIKRLGISQNLYSEFYSEGIIALWQAYKNYQPEKGNIGTFLNYQIRFRLIDLLRKKIRREEVTEQAIQEEETKIDDGNRHKTSGLPLVNPKGIPLANDEFWQEVRKHLTDKQWKWVKYFIIADLSIKEITEIEGVSATAVKSWGREVRRKLRKEDVRKRLEELL